MVAAVHVVAAAATIAVVDVAASKVPNGKVRGKARRKAVRR